MKYALAQINPTVGALDANRAKIMDFYHRAAAMGADLVIFPEMAVIGYPPRDLVSRPDFIRRNMEIVESMAAEMTGPGAIVGYVQPQEHHDQFGKGLFNAAALIDGGQIISKHYKSLLPTYDVFDEGRYFEPAHEIQMGLFRGHRLAITICEDFWNTELYADEPRRMYRRDPVAELGKQDPDIMINIAASPYSLRKRWLKTAMYQGEILRWGVPLIQVNQVGGNDNLIFDGWSNVWEVNTEVAAQAKDFEEDLVLWDSDAEGDSEPPDAGDSEDTLYRALVMGVQDYVAKCGFKKTVIGLSGGIDSALTAAIAVDALGAENVVGVAMPSEFSSSHSIDDARRLALNLGIEFHIVEIKPIYDTFIQQLAPVFEGTEFGIAEENIQARSRGNLLMAISNKFGYLVLSTGNKSEMAVGYCTLYGDMSGGLSVLADVFKTRVYSLARWVNREGERIPVNTINKPPSAELRPDQFDTDSLPPYEVLDPIIRGYVEFDEPVDRIVKSTGAPRELVERIARMIDRNEYKRQQAAVCLKVTMRAFGSGRRMPIARGT